MTELYGQAWIRQCGPEPHGDGAQTWAGVLAGLTLGQIAAGIEGAIELGRDYPPSAPRFRALCLQLPSIHEVRRTLTKHPPTPFIRLVWTFIDQREFSSAYPDRAELLLQGAYEGAHRHAMRGGSYPPPTVAEIAQEVPKPKRASIKTINQGMRNIAMILGELPPDELSESEK